jgi:hypothetical protein
VLQIGFLKEDDLNVYKNVIFYLADKFRGRVFMAFRTNGLSFLTFMKNSGQYMID